jgi:hypothetical protein
MIAQCQVPPPSPAVIVTEVRTEFYASPLETYDLLLGSEATCLEDHYIFADLYNKIFSSIENPAGRYDTTARFRDLIHFVTRVNGVNNQLED